MGINKYKGPLAGFASDRDWDQYHTPKNLSMSVAIEAGELMELFQWLPLGSFPLKTEVAQEIADVMIYLIRLADVMGIDIDKAIADKIADNEKKYPVKLSKGNAIKYNKREAADE